MQPHFTRHFSDMSSGSAFASILLSYKTSLKAHTSDYSKKCKK